MDRNALAKAESRLRIAKKAVSDMEASKTFTDLSDHWYVFLTSAKNVYTMLEQGSKASPQSRQWFGAKKNVRKNDPLLQYLYEARNDDEHGLGSSVKLKPERHEYGVSAPGYSSAMRIDGGPLAGNTFINCGTAVVIEGDMPPPDIRLTSLDGKPVLNRKTPATAILVDVAARGNRTYAPPSMHLGKRVPSALPIPVARLALSYLEDLILEASKLA